MTGRILSLTQPLASSASRPPGTSPEVEAMVAGGLVAFTLAVGAYHLAFFLRRREGWEHLLLAALCGLAIAHGATLARPLASLLAEQLDAPRLRLLTLMVAAPLYVGLLARLLSLPLRTRAQAAVLGLGLTGLVLAVLPAGALHWAGPLPAGLVGVGLLASVVWVVRRAPRRSPGTWILMVGTLSLTLAVLWDLLVPHVGIKEVYLLPGARGAFWPGFLLFLVAVGLETSGSFALAAVRARTDPLTGLTRRHVFEEAVAREAERRRRAGGNLILLVLDLDHFKQINDSYGHRAGDVVLERVGHLLRHSARNIDLTARLGGEEFGVLLSDTDTEGAGSFAHRFRTRLRELEVTVPGGTISGLTTSVGVAVSTGWAATDTLLDAADRAMYQAKQAGRDRVVTVMLPGDRHGSRTSSHP